MKIFLISLIHNNHLFPNTLKPVVYRIQLADLNCLIQCLTPLWRMCICGVCVCAHVRVLVLPPNLNALCREAYASLK